MGFGAFLVTFCAGKKSPGVRGRVAPERVETNNLSPHPPGERRISPAKAKSKNLPLFEKILLTSAKESGKVTTKIIIPQRNDGTK